MNRVLAASEPETKFKTQDTMRLFDRAISVPNLRFIASFVTEFAALAPHCLDTDRRRAMERIHSNLHAAENLLDETYRIARQFAEAHENAQRISLAQRFLDEYEDAIVNLGKTVEMCDLYQKGEYSTVLTK
jgi:hypothetical protein